MAEDKLTHPVNILMIGGSAGSLDVILRLLPELHTDIHFPIVIVLHRRNVAEVSLAELLAHKTKLPVREVEEKDLLKAGTIYIAPPDYHLLIEKDHSFSLDYSERVHHSRPSIDVSFIAASDAYGAGVAGMLLSGANADGAAGLRIIKEAGGLAIIQDPDTAEVAYMPRQAMAQLQPDHILPPQHMAGFINAL